MRDVLTIATPKGIIRVKREDHERNMEWMRRRAMGESYDQICKDYGCGKANVRLTVKRYMDAGVKVEADASKMVN